MSQDISSPLAGDAKADPEPRMAFCPACFVEVTPEQANAPILKALREVAATFGLDYEAVCRSVTDLLKPADLPAGKSVTRNASASDNCDGMILADGYRSGMTLSDPTGHHEVSLHYRSREQAEAAFDVITTLIDAANGARPATANQSGEDRAAFVSPRKSEDE